MVKKTNFSYLYGLAYSNFGEGNYQEAYSYIKQLIADFPQDPNVLLLQGHICVGLENYNLANQAYRAVIKFSERQDLIECAQHALNQIDEETIHNHDNNGAKNKHKRIDRINFAEDILQDNQYNKSNNLEEKLNLFDQKNEIELLKKEIEDLKIKVNQFNLQNITASLYPYLLQDKNVIKLIDFPLSRVIDIYHEAPQILEANGCLVSLIDDRKNIIFELNNIGNFWLFQLRDQGFYLFPKPAQLQRASVSDSFSKVFIIENKENQTNGKFIVLKPAKLQILKVDFSWQLIEPGEIKFEEFSLEFQWQQEIKSIRKEHEKFNQLLDERGYASLDFTIVSQHWEQSLTKLYGTVYKVFVNICMPIAYAIYKDQILVPCQILMGTNPVIVPGWDRGIPWEHSIYVKLHASENTSRQEIRTFPNHKLLPNQLYLKETNWEINHTWTIAKSYEEASAILRKLVDNWELLEYPILFSAILENFNIGNTDYFQSDNFFFLNLTAATRLGIQGVGIDVKPIVEFQKIIDNTDPALYIGFHLDDNCTYLIPNLLISKWKQVISNNENKIFELHGSNYTLVEPAVIEAIGNDIWRLVKPGKFD
ncbi:MULTISPECIES: tol-pal system YbgF family protein [unclassified Synechocystis]|uniref:tetratricopeptide repeat protein n=1 Tax=unclassified Synechocystis TaxID=2640012 RepID=UPI000413CF30|nr:MULTISPECIES: hypothetical protein [unclassified Synechocystis]AIE73990.1 hypothetical protein D082_14620 [Synechocystis sp. PCC 6714]MCT0252551.1 hypothetical protein [Synechocystis sp. CS-94]